jgi:hypothetical protein
MHICVYLFMNTYIYTYIYKYIYACIYKYDDDIVYLKTITTRGAKKFNPTQKCRPAKGISKRVNIQIIKDNDITEQPVHTCKSIHTI